MKLKNVKIGGGISLIVYEPPWITQDPIIDISVSWDDTYNYDWTGFTFGGTITGLTNPEDYYVESLCFVTGDTYYFQDSGSIDASGVFSGLTNWTGYKQIRIKRNSDDVCVAFENYSSGTGQWKYDSYTPVYGRVGGSGITPYSDYEVWGYDVTDIEYRQVPPPAETTPVLTITAGGFYSYDGPYDGGTFALAYWAHSGTQLVKLIRKSDDVIMATNP